jgi:hypothetical protein
VENNVVGLNQAARFHYQLGRFDEALDLALRARDLDFHADTQEILGLIFFEHAQYDKAVFHFERAHRNAEVLAKSIQGEIRLGHPREAMFHAQEASQVADAGKELVELIQTAVQLGNRHQQLWESVKLSREEKNNFTLRQKWGQAIDAFVCAEYLYWENKNEPAVADLLIAALAKDVQFGPAFALRALLCLEKGQVRLALEDADQGVRLSGEEALAYFARGRVRFERGDKGALDDLNKAARLEPGNLVFVEHAQIAAAELGAK